MHRPPRFHGFIFKRNDVVKDLLNYFSDGKNKPIKRTEQFISSIKNLRVNVYFTFSEFRTSPHVFVLS